MADELPIESQIDVLEREIVVQDEELKRLRAEYAALFLLYRIPSPAERLARISKISELAKELRSKRARLGWLRKRWIPVVESVMLYQYATRGDPDHRYPYKWVITYDWIDCDYDHLKDALKKRNYWERYWRTNRLKILRVRDGYRYAFEEKKGRPVVYVLRRPGEGPQVGDVYVTQKAYSDKPYVCEHQAAFTCSILKTLGLVRGYHRERVAMTATELEYIPVRTTQVSK